MHTSCTNMHSCYFYAYVLSVVLMFWTNLTLIKFVFMLFFICNWPLCFCSYVCKCLHSRRQLWKEVATKRKEPVIDVDNLSPRPKRTWSPTGVYDLDKFKAYATFQTYENYFREASWLVERAIDIHLSLKPKFGTSFSPTLMIHTRTWWKSSMLMPLLKERS